MFIIIIVVLIDPTAAELNAVDTPGWISFAVTAWDILLYGLPLAGFIYRLGWAIDVF